MRDVMFGDRRYFRELLAGSEEGIASNILASGSLAPEPTTAPAPGWDNTRVLGSDLAGVGRVTTKSANRPRRKSPVPVGASRLELPFPRAEPCATR